MRPRFLGQTTRPATFPPTLPSSEVAVTRFEVTDESRSKFIPGATVSIVLEDGTPLISKKTDSGGNVAFGKREVIAAGEQVGYGESGRASSVIWYVVEAPGYLEQDGILYDPENPAGEAQYQKVFSIALKEEPVSDSSGMVVAGMILLGTAAAIWLASQD